MTEGWLCCGHICPNKVSIGQQDTLARMKIPCTLKLVSHLGKTCDMGTADEVMHNWAIAGDWGTCTSSSGVSGRCIDTSQCNGQTESGRCPGRSRNVLL